jgi:hypothetical protein
MPLRICELTVLSTIATEHSPCPSYHGCHDFTEDVHLFDGCSFAFALWVSLYPVTCLRPPSSAWKEVIDASLSAS